MNDRPSDSELRRIESKWSKNDPLQKITDDDRLECLRLVEEVRRLSRLISHLYDHVQPTPGTEDLQAELEREVMAIRSEPSKA